MSRPGSILLALLLWLGLTIQAAGASDMSNDRSFEYADRVVVHKSERKLHLMRDGEVMKSFDIALGKQPLGHKEREGDKRTPEGSYLLDARNPNSKYFLSIKVSYPNSDDASKARRKGVDPGGQIMIHGHPNEPKYSRAYYESRDWTDGCIAVSDAAMVEIWMLTRENTPIDIRP